MNKTVVIVGHPDLSHGSIANQIIVEQLKDQENMEIRDLGQMYPEFRINIAEEQSALLAADTIVFQFPFYWYSVPGIMKEWIDKVLTYGFAYGSNGTKLHGKRFLVSITVGGSEDAYQHNGYNTYEIEELLRPLKQTSNLCGMTYLPPVLTHNMIYIPDVYNVKEEVEQRALDHARRLIETITSS